MKKKNIGIVILAVFLLIILFQNTQVASFQILFWKITASRIFLILLGVIIGFVLGFWFNKKI